ncbi:magnesium transporter NIPA-domain-containing protein [Polychytrium aggregatum]|uniref:magnesium transporter NIPA-domain-containing protein n=1 Tax=Polychytrium aggregatum TaxID=110093 RepID=UPI0022FDB3E3|nr:magnesium transporter NIPA-domain-containing protein [Polychytrium aggregatum]KAI9209490.1 magnesium transporter NIPA-domain-containing protein [Polychytrium aggregatum]
MSVVTLSHFGALRPFYLTATNDTITTDVTANQPSWYTAVGIILALTSGLFIGSSFIFKKKGLLDTNALGHEAGVGHAYLKNGMWWTGMILMGLGEVANFGAYAFTPAIMVTPLGALSVVISAILSSIFLKERLNFSGKIGCAQCVVGATIIVLHAPKSNTTKGVDDFFGYVLRPGFIVYSVLCTGAILYLIFILAPKYGDKHPIVYISICSFVGSFLVLSCQGFGAALVYTAAHWTDDNQFLRWPLYLLIAFIAFTICVQINYLNKALNLFSTAIVTPVYYVFFTTATLVASIILFGFQVTDPISSISIICGFLVIVGGVALLFQYSLKLTKMSALTRLTAEPPGEAQPQENLDEPGVVVITPNKPPEETEGVGPADSLDSIIIGSRTSPKPAGGPDEGVALAEIHPPLPQPNTPASGSAPIATLTTLRRHVSASAAHVASNVSNALQFLSRDPSRPAPAYVHIRSVPSAAPSIDSDPVQK